MPEAGSTKHENPPIPPLVKGGWGDFHINHGKKDYQCSLLHLPDKHFQPYETKIQP